MRVFAIRIEHSLDVGVKLLSLRRARLGHVIFATWDQHDVDELVRLMREFADAVIDDPPPG
jgi:hypothetical protein